MGKEGLSAPINAESKAGRDESGRFLPGHGIKSPGRPSRQREVEMLDAIKTTLPKDRVIALIEKMIDMAIAVNSWRGLESALRLAYDYGVGKPVQRIIQEQGGLGDLADELGIDLSE